MRWDWIHKRLLFKRPGGTSRGVLVEKDAYFFRLNQDGAVFYGECGLLKGLSADDRPDYADKLNEAVKQLNNGVFDPETWREWPSIQFGVEMAQRAAEQGSEVYFPSDFTQGSASIPINGLIWMGDAAFMKEQISARLKDGFHCLKMKIGAIDWETERGILRELRRQFPAADLELRVDANGAFRPENVYPVLEELAALEIHSIEQPLPVKFTDELAEVCARSPVPVALDESLIGRFSPEEKRHLLETHLPPFIILKPSFIGGWKGTQEWIDLAEEKGIGWWITSALESNIGLNAIAQYTAMLRPEMAQGLGTGSLYKENVEAPLEVLGGALFYRPERAWNYSLLQ